MEVSQKNKKRYPEGTHLINLGKLYQTIGEYDKALDSYQQGLKTVQQIGYRQLESEAFILLGELFCERREYARAIESLSTARSIAEEIGKREFVFRACHALSHVYEQQGNFGEALNYYKAFYEYREKVVGEEADKNLKRVMVQAEIEKAQKETEIHQLKQVELAARVRELEDAQAHIKQLQSLLPICSSCKSIRKDDNYWESVESYVSQSTGTQFTNGVCPDCYQKEVLPTT